MEAARQGPTVRAVFTEAAKRFLGLLGQVPGICSCQSAPEADATVAQRVEWRVCGSLCDTSGRPFRAYLYLSAIISEAPHSAHFRVYRGEQALLTKHIRRGVYSAPRALAQWP